MTRDGVRRCGYCGEWAWRHNPCTACDTPEVGLEAAVAAELAHAPAARGIRPVAEGVRRA